MRYFVKLTKADVEYTAICVKKNACTDTHVQNRICLHKISLEMAKCGFLWGREPGDLD